MDDQEKIEERKKLSERILHDFPRLKEEDSFAFACNPSVSCFTDCCADINIALTPYDVLQMKNHLNISSGEFLQKYTVTIASKDMQLPVVMLKMGEDEKKACQFLGEGGCTIYDARPWPCRMYPLGYASPGGENSEITEPFYFLMQEPMCKGFAESGGTEWTVGKWLDDQGLKAYNEEGELWKQITLHSFFNQGKELSPQQLDVFHMAGYDIDKFRSFVFESTFLKRFDVEDETIEKMRESDLELLHFAYRWLRFFIFHEPVMSIRKEYIEAARKDVERYEKSKEK